MHWRTRPGYSASPTENKRSSHSKTINERPHLKSNVLDALDRRPVQVLVVLAGLDEEMCLDVGLHLVDAGHEVIVAPVHLVLPASPGGVGDTRAESVRKLPHEVVIDPVLDGAEDDDGPCELQVYLLHGLVGENLSISSLLPASYGNI